MPLQHSPSESALHANIATEIRAGRPVAQAVVIAFDVQRRARKKRRMRRSKSLRARVKSKAKAKASS